MRESARRVALLARSGPARERLHSALVQIGAELVLEGDPAQLDPSEISATRPEVVLVALDPATEQALDRFEAVLEDPAIEVMFEEAEVAAHREGWDAARWIRHLDAKLMRHGDVLPSATGREAPPALAEPRPAPAAQAHAVPDPVGPAAAVDAGAALLDLDDVAMPVPAIEPPPAHPLSDDFSPGVDPGTFAGFDPVAAEMAEAEETADQVIAFDFPLGDALDLEFASPAAPDAALPEPGLVFESELALPSAPADAGADLSFDEALHFDGLSLDGLQGATAADDTAPGLAFDPVSAEADDIALDFAVEAVAVADAPAPPPAAPHYAFELAQDDAAPAVPVDPAAPGAPRRTPDLAEIERRIASLELVDDRPPVAAAAPGVSGAIVVLAGLGGPDAVRQLLGALPVPFARPVLIQQRLDGGRYDKLVTQLQRATALPVELAVAGGTASPGTVYILPATLGVTVADGALCFAADAPLLDALPSDDSAVLLLSGSDPAQVDAVAALAARGAFAAGQAEEGCYDPAAPNALALRGGATGQPAELAGRLAERWASA